MCFAVKQKLALLTARKKADEAEKEVLRRIANRFYVFSCRN